LKALDWFQTPIYQLFVITRAAEEDAHGASRKTDQVIASFGQAHDMYTSVEVHYLSSTIS
jgi:hypothetical protein